jgi:hypothetical protein
MAVLIVVYRITDGSPVSHTDDPRLVASPLPAGLASATFDPAPDLDAQMWDAPTQTFVPRPAPTHTALYTAVTALIQKDPMVTPWTPSDLANALRALLAMSRNQVS